MAFPLLVTIATRFLVRLGSVQVQRTLVERGALSSVRGALIRVPGIATFGKSQTLVGRILAGSGKDALKNLGIRFGQNEISAQIISQLSKRTDLLGENVSVMQARRDVAELEKDLSTIAGRADVARRAALEVLGAAWGRGAKRFSPVDTHRYIAGWDEALSGAGVPGFEVENVTVSDFALELADSFDEQAEFWMTAQADRRSPSDVIAGIIDRSRRSASKLRDFRIQITDIDVDRSTIPELVVDLILQAPIGGRGAMDVSSSSAALELVNLEPHAQAVESRHRATARARAQITQADRDAALRAYVTTAVKGTHFEESAA